MTQVDFTTARNFIANHATDKPLEEALAVALAAAVNAGRLAEDTTALALKIPLTNHRTALLEAAALVIETYNLGLGDIRGSPRSQGNGARQRF